MTPVPTLPAWEPVLTALAVGRPARSVAVRIPTPECGIKNKPNP